MNMHLSRYALSLRLSLCQSTYSSPLYAGFHLLFSCAFNERSGIFSIPTRSCRLQTTVLSSLSKITIDRSDYPSTINHVPDSISIRIPQKKNLGPPSFPSSHNHHGENTQATTEAIAAPLSVTHIMGDVSFKLYARYRMACTFPRRVIHPGSRSCSSVTFVNDLWDVELGSYLLLYFRPPFLTRQ